MEPAPSSSTGSLTVMAPWASRALAMASWLSGYPRAEAAC